MSINVDPLRLSKPQDSSTYLAIKTIQGGRAVYATRVPLLDLPTILPVPDPNNVDKDNRKVDRLHAKHFGEYLDTKQDWVAPALLARDGGGCTYEKVDEHGAVGYLTVPWAIGGISALRTIDGQHRVLGVAIEKQRITDAISAIDREMARKVSPEKAAKLQAERERLVGQMNRLKAEYVGLDIYVEPDPIKAQQMFVDVADNAKGISSAVRARFDSYKVANRTLSDVIDHPLLKGKVDAEQDRMTIKNPNLMGAKHVADITRSVIAGAGGRISKKAEQTLTDGEVIEQVKDYLDVISNAFTDLAAITEDDPEAERKHDEPTLAQKLRRTSLLGSVGMLRVLGGVFRELRAGDNPAELDDITEFFKRLDPHMEAPVTETSIWRTTEANVDFELDAGAPIMRTQNIVHLVGVITSWYKKAPASL
ncbi:DndB-like DNA-sulfur modification-associated protein [Herbihabitans rhizosphaerae]|uniref:DndB-like DNA-sulfur modification-associated protein n=1 Tax=Herbihabitans rhizosphaerae TaxID=1872711 RepID=A0A4V2ESH3_9PSEU|nr:DNA sulfur modification protein DndB [Herbihabitans rhizosphaerae]RZS37573.1 DndB-like DNA-sulfur modification-associated protein [Herbihabitans rhizosphaerae]